VSLGVFWDGRRIGRLTRVDERSREYAFSYVEGALQPVSLSLPLVSETFTPSQSRPFFEALLPEGAVRDRIAGELKLAASDSYGLLAALGRDCAGALQIVEDERMSDPVSVRWLSDGELDALIAELPRRPLGVRPEDGRMRLSLAGVQHKAVLARDRDGRFGEPLNGFPSTHILKPDLAESTYPALATNEYFCMRLAERCGLTAARVELLTAAGRACLAVERFDRDLTVWPPTRTHQEDLCQALGLTPDFKYQQAGWDLPSHAALARLLNEHSARPGADRLAAAEAAVFHFLIGNADAHAKNISLLHVGGGIRLAPMYDAVSTAAYPDLSPQLAMAIGDELDPTKISVVHWGDLAVDFGLNLSAFERVRTKLAGTVVEEAEALAGIAHEDGWHDPVIDGIREVITERSEQAAPR
jgi:serine/threonine-protein kinase HipA